MRVYAWRFSEEGEKLKNTPRAGCAKLCWGLKRLEAFT